MSAPATMTSTTIRIRTSRPTMPTASVCRTERRCVSQDGSKAGLGRPPDDGVGEDEVGQTDAEMGHDDSARVGRAMPPAIASPRVAVGSG